MKQFRVFAQSPAVEGGFEALYAQTVDQALRGTGTETFEAIDMLRKADPVALPAGKWRALSERPRGPDDAAGGAAHKADIGLEVTFVDTGGWDNHVNEGGAQGQLSNLLRDLGQSHGGVFAGYGRPHGRHRRGHHVRIRPHRARKRQPRHRSWPRQLHVGDGRSREGRQSLRQLAGPGSRTAQRRPRPDADYRFPLRAGRR